MKNYETPCIRFDKLLLFEKIADQCWAGDMIKFDDANDNIPESLISINKDGGCGDDELKQFLEGVQSYYSDTTKYSSWYATHIEPGHNYSETKTEMTFVPIS